MQFKHGFIYMGVRYGWNKKQLYRLPFNRNLRHYDLKLIKPMFTVAHFDKAKKANATIEMIKSKYELTAEIEAQYNDYGTEK